MSSTSSIRTAAILVGEVGEAPDVAEADGVAETAEQEVETTRPVATLLVLVLAEVLTHVVIVVRLVTCL